jgi:hypothetical protein
LNISEIVAQKHLLARITALEIAVAKLEQTPEVRPLSREQIGSTLEELVQYAGTEKRKPGRPRKNA